jgi:hypothetical protein
MRYSSIPSVGVTESERCNSKKKIPLQLLPIHHINPAHSLCIRCVYHACFTAFLCHISQMFLFLFSRSLSHPIPHTIQPASLYICSSHSCVMYKIFIYIHLQKKSKRWGAAAASRWIFLTNIAAVHFGEMIQNETRTCVSLHARQLWQMQFPLERLQFNLFSFF